MCDGWRSGKESGNPSALWREILQADSREREELIRRLVSHMSLQDKTGQMAGRMRAWEMLASLVRYNLRPFKAGEDPRLGIPPLLFTDGPRGVAMGRSTCFPVPMARAASWDTELEERVGAAMGVEALSQGANLLGAPCVNLLRHPGWGRAQETYGEDPFLLGEMGAALVRGLQRHVMACVKHYACNSIEESRFHVDVRLDERTLREIYLPHFKRCVDEGVAAVMSAYNRVNGEYCAHNTHLLREILKDEWSFQGFVISDFILGTRDTVKAALGGLDLEMPQAWHFGRKLRRAVRRGEVPEEIVDEAVMRILRQKARFCRHGEGDYGAHRVASSEHTALALEAARKGIVLLKNKEGTLPLRLGKKGKLAVVGKLADLPNIGDRGSSRVRPPYVITVLQGLRERGGDSLRLHYSEGKDRREALLAARSADACLVVVGLTAHDEGEVMPGPFKLGRDREDLSLRPGDIDLLEEITRVNPRCVVVLEGGSALLTSGWRGRVGALLMAWYPGMEGGNALAEVLFGLANPCGKLPVTFPESNRQLPFFDPRAREIEYGYYHGYRLFDKMGMRPAFPFGFGLSYTAFAYRKLRLSADETAPDGSIVVEADIHNAGDREGEEVVQLYVGYPSPSLDRPVKELKGFAGVRLRPGETGTVSLTLRAADLAYYHAGEGRWKVDRGPYHLYVGSSSHPRDLHLKASFRVT